MISLVLASRRRLPKDSPRREVEDSMRRCAHPLAQISCVRQRHTACDDTCLNFCLCRNIARARDDDFVGRSDLAANQLHFVRDEKPYCLHILALAPPTRENIPLFKAISELLV